MLRLRAGDTALRQRKGRHGPINIVWPYNM